MTTKLCLNVADITHCAIEFDKIYLLHQIYKITLEKLYALVIALIVCEHKLKQSNSSEQVDPPILSG